MSNFVTFYDRSHDNKDKGHWNFNPSPEAINFNPLMTPGAICQSPKARTFSFFFVGDHCLDDPLPEIITPFFDRLLVFVDCNLRLI